VCVYLHTPFQSLLLSLLLSLRGLGQSLFFSWLEEKKPWDKQMNPFWVREATSDPFLSYL
jgi:hypothetical protein